MDLNGIGILIFGKSSFNDGNDSRVLTTIYRDGDGE